MRYAAGERSPKGRGVSRMSEASRPDLGVSSIFRGATAVARRLPETTSLSLCVEEDFIYLRKPWICGERHLGHWAQEMAGPGRRQSMKLPPTDFPAIHSRFNTLAGIVLNPAPLLAARQLQ
jgi:hypothetical protein